MLSQALADFTRVSLAPATMAASSSSVMSMARLKAWVSEVLNVGALPSCSKAASHERRQIPVNEHEAFLRSLGIGKAPHAWRPQLVRPTPLILGYRERAIGTGVSVVPPIGTGWLDVCPVMYPRLCIGLAKPAARNKRDHGGSDQCEGVVHYWLPSQS
jgi:hypothetical protein